MVLNIFEKIKFLNKSKNKLLQNINYFFRMLLNFLKKFISYLNFELEWIFSLFINFNSHEGFGQQVIVRIKDRAIKGLVVCNVLYYGYEVKDQESGLELTS